MRLPQRATHNFQPAITVLWQATVPAGNVSCPGDLQLQRMRSHGSLRISGTRVQRGASYTIFLNALTGDRSSHALPAKVCSSSARAAMAACESLGRECNRGRATPYS